MGEPARSPFHRFKKGERVRALLHINYIASRVEIAMGTTGVVARVHVGGFLPLVTWEGRTDELATSFDSLEPLDDEPPAEHAP